MDYVIAQHKLAAFCDLKKKNSLKTPWKMKHMLHTSIQLWVTYAVKEYLFGVLCKQGLR